MSTGGRLGAKSRHSRLTHWGLQFKEFTDSIGTMPFMLTDCPLPTPIANILVYCSVVWCVGGARILYFL
jgi:hypothetical protein